MLTHDSLSRGATRALYELSSRGARIAPCRSPSREATNAPCRFPSRGATKAPCRRACPPVSQSEHLKPRRGDSLNRCRRFAAVSSGNGKHPAGKPTGRVLASRWDSSRHPCLVKDTCLIGTAFMLTRAIDAARQQGANVPSGLQAPMDSW